MRAAYLGLGQVTSMVIFNHQMVGYSFFYITDRRPREEVENTRDMYTICISAWVIAQGVYGVLRPRAHGIINAQTLNPFHKVISILVHGERLACLVKLDVYTLAESSNFTTSRATISSIPDILCFLL